MRCFGERDKLSIEYEVIDEEGYLEFWIDNKELCCFYKNGKKQRYKWDLLCVFEWLVDNKDYILNETQFPLPVNANSSIDFWNKSGEFDSDNFEEDYTWFKKRQDWYFRHSWYSNRSGSFLAEIFFRRTGEKIEVEWDNTCLYDEIEFVNPKGIYYVNVEMFERIIDSFVKDYKSNYIKKSTQSTGQGHLL